ARVYVLKNNVDSRGNSYGCHENYLIRRQGELSRVTDVLIPFLITRQLLSGAGRLHVAGEHATYLISQRADHIWDGLSSATTRSRPIINTRDEPHADAERFRRLHVIVGDSTMSEVTTLLKVASTDLVLRMIESGVTTRDLTLDNPIRAIRDISRDTEGTQLVSLVGGRKLTAVQVQTEFLERVSTFAESRGLHRVEPYRRVLELWERTLKAIASQDLSMVETEIEWVMNLRMMQRYAEAHDLPMSHPRLQQLDLAWHDIHPTRGPYNILARRGQAATVTAPGQVQRARHT